MCLVARLLVTLGIFACACSLPVTKGDETLRVMLIDGQNNHRWQETTPLIKRTLEATGRFTVDVVTSPAAGSDMSTFRPDFAPYAAVISNYNGIPWPEETQRAFERYVASGRGFVSVHAANNSFPKWTQYNRMIGLGGWGDRTEEDGPYVRWRNEQIVRDFHPGRGGSHGSRHPFQIVVRDAEHPITSGLPRSFMQAEDELYGELRGPAENMHVLATAYSDPNTGGTGEHEPILMSIHYGDGRIFHTTLGHDVTAMQGTAFQVTLQRGAEWAATGAVTLAPPDPALLTDAEPSLRDPATIGTKATVALADRTPNPTEEGWVSLFNGQNLESWTQKNGTASFTVEEGMIVGRTAIGSPNSYLCTTSEYKNFELSFEVKVDDELNSGVQIRSRSLPEVQSGRVQGLQVEIEARDEDGESDSGYLFSEATGRNWISTNRTVLDAFNNGQWNRFLVRAVGNRVQTWVNGRKIEDLADEQFFPTGFIALQVHSIEQGKGPYEVRFRDLKVRILDDQCELR